MGACLIVLGWTAEIVGLFVTEKELVRAVRSLIDRLAIDKTVAETNVHDRSSCPQYLCSGLCNQRRYGLSEPVDEKGADIPKSNHLAGA